MCFDQRTSLIFSLLGVILTIILHKITRNYRFSVGAFYFFLMEFLQAIQYSFIDRCDDPMNKVLTVLGYLHVCFQPFFLNLIISGTNPHPDKQLEFRFVLKLTLLGGILMVSRFLLSPYTPIPYRSECSTEWMRGDKLCTYSGNVHLAWTVPAYEASYLASSPNLHFTLMFFPFFIIDYRLIISGIILMLTGPILSMYITDNFHEQPSIWCFFSISQICCMVVSYVLIHGSSTIRQWRRERKHNISNENHKNKIKSN